MNRPDRRNFLKSSAALAAGVSTISAAALVRAGANNRIRVGVVGLGGRGQNHVHALHASATEDVELAALCDCDETSLTRSAAAYEKLSGKKVAVVNDLRKLLDDKSIDAVSFATPNHWHSLGVIWACQAGKDAYVEKPGSHNVFEGRDLLVEVEVRNWYTNTEAGMGEQFPFGDHQSVVGVIFVGREGYMLFPDYSSYYTFLGRDRRPGPTKSIAGEPMMDTDHLRNWIAAVRSRDPRDLAADIEEGHLSCALCHLANVAQRTRRTVAFDPQAERFANDEEANRLLSRPYRPPYVVPERV